MQVTIALIASLLAVLVSIAAVLVSAKRDPGHRYSPEAEADATGKRMNAAFTLAIKVEAGEISQAAAKLALMVGGYDGDIVAQVDNLIKTTPEDAAGIKMGVECVDRLLNARRVDEDIGDVLDRLLALSDAQALGEAADVQ